jgi:hypothetical protein
MRKKGLIKGNRLCPCEALLETVDSMSLSSIKEVLSRVINDACYRKDYRDS